MSDLERMIMATEVYRLEDRSDTVSKAKSQFSEEYNVDYSKLKGTVLQKGYGNKDRLCVIVKVK